MPIHPDGLATVDDSIGHPANLMLRRNVASYWEKVLLPAKGSNLPLTWLMWPMPITSRLSGSSVWQPENQPEPPQEPRSRDAARHTAALQNLPAGSASVGDLLTV